jgi:8-oxo-dGTP pyrophosphatase MutT (NUDIX family)
MATKVHAVGVIFEDLRTGQILVLRRHALDPEGGTWGLVGGKVDGDENAKETALREAEEEIGYDIDSTKLEMVKTYQWDRDDLNLTFEVFRLRTASDEVAVILDDTESSEFLWVLPQELYKRKNLMIGLYPILEDMYQIK